MSTNPTCTTCTDAIPGPHLLIERNPICHPCFRHLFTLALTSESSFPASWANEPLSPSRYAHILGPELLRAYHAKALEYTTPLQERVYCARTDPPRRPAPCGAFVGRGREDKACVRCAECMWYTCLRCEESFSTADVGGEEVEIRHECDPRMNAELEERAFSGLVRGVDWQFCPNEECRRRVELSDGCNHIRCLCRAHFCFVCGYFVRDGEGHWRREGGCPRFGKKGDERAIYDDNDSWNDNDDIGDEERAGEIQRREYGYEAGLGRAFEVQISMVEEARREIQEQEARRAQSRQRESEVASEDPPRRHRRRRRKDSGREQDASNEERPNDRPRRRKQEALRFGSSKRASEYEDRKRRGLRTFIRNSINTAENILFGKPNTRGG